MTDAVPALAESTPRRPGAAGRPPTGRAHVPTREISDAARTLYATVAQAAPDLRARLETLQQRGKDRGIAAETVEEVRGVLFAAHQPEL